MAFFTNFVVLAGCVAFAAAANLCFEFTNIRDIGGPLRDIDWSNVGVKETNGRYTVTGYAVINRQLQDPFMIGYEIAEFVNNLPQNNFLQLPTVNVCKQLNNQRKLYSPILQRFNPKNATKCADIETGKKDMTGVSLNQVVYKLTGPKENSVYNGTITFLDSAGNSQIIFSGRAYKC